ncbi:hypothetical protein [Allokutzneria oryzae]|uniref:Uncharacterized protein n=1 Tax=Allokutzneria oryzae TaxID=1378989 RepID=A0ABV5ZRM6_9PSEU
MPAAGRLLRHTWSIEQSGRPEILGRNKWAALSPKDSGVRAVGKLLGGLVDSVFSLGAEGGDQPTERTLLWLAGEAKVMRSTGYDFESTATWLDRRLAFAVAVAVLGDR